MSSDRSRRRDAQLAAESQLNHYTHTIPIQSYDDCGVSLSIPQQDTGTRGDGQEILSTGQEIHQPEFANDNEVKEHHQDTSALIESQARALFHETQRLKIARDRTLGFRDRVFYKWEGCRDARRFVGESQRGFMAAMEDALDASMPESLRSNLRSWYNRAQADHEELERQAVETGKLEYKLTRFEHAMHKREKQVSHITEQLLTTLQQAGLSETVYTPNNISGTSSFDHSTTSEDVPYTADAPSKTMSTIESYYDKSGNVKIMQDRLHEVEIDYLTTQESRGIQQDQDLTLSVPDLEFEESYHLARRKAEEDLHDAVLLRDDALLACYAEGVRPEIGKPLQSETADEADENLAGPSPEVELHVPSNTQDVTFSSTEQEPQLRRVRDSVSSLDPQGGRSSPFQRWVQSWMAATENREAEASGPLSLADELEAGQLPIVDTPDALDRHIQRKIELERKLRLFLQSPQHRRRSRAPANPDDSFPERPSIHSRSSSESKLTSLNVSQEDLAYWFSTLRKGDAANGFGPNG